MCDELSEEGAASRRQSLFLEKWWNSWSVSLVPTHAGPTWGLKPLYGICTCLHSAMVFKPQGSDAADGMEKQFISLPSSGVRCSFPHSDFFKILQEPKLKKKKGYFECVCIQSGPSDEFSNLIRAVFCPHPWCLMLCILTSVSLLWVLFGLVLASLQVLFLC